MSHSQKICVIDDDSSIRWVLDKALQKAGLAVISFESGDAALSAIGREEPAVVVTDIRMPGIDGLELLERINSQYPELPVIIMTAHSDLDSAVAAYKGGAFEYLPKPFDVNDAVALVNRAMEVRAQQPAKNIDSVTEVVPEIVGKAPAMQEVFRAIGRLARSNITVLINGESGTGKELIAREIHRRSQRRDRPLIKVNCATIPKELYESEFFGHVKGAFTGAVSDRMGRFEAADGGTLFLDEIGDMSLQMQVKILRVLQERTFERVGSNKSITSDVRIIAATHKNLEEAITEGAFREDLFYRLNVFPIEMPPLRERLEDIPLLVNELVRRIEHEKRGSVRLSPGAIYALCQYTWPGNVRELANLVERMAILHPYGVVDAGDLPDKFRTGGDGEVSEQVLDALVGSPPTSDDLDPRLPRDGLNLKEHLSHLEISYIKQALADSGGIVAHAAKRLGMRRTTLVEKLRKYGLQRQA